MKILGLMVVVGVMTIQAIELKQKPVMDQSGICDMSAKSVAMGYLYGDRKGSPESFCRNYILSNSQNTRCDEEKMIKMCSEEAQAKLKKEAGE